MSMQIREAETPARVDAPAIVRPRGAARRYDVSEQTIARWEKSGRLPKRDFFIGGVAEGWHVATLEAADRGETSAA